MERETTSRELTNAAAGILFDVLSLSFILLSVGNLSPITGSREGNESTQNTTCLIELFIIVA